MGTEEVTKKMSTPKAKAGQERKQRRSEKLTFVIRVLPVAVPVFQPLPQALFPSGSPLLPLLSLQILADLVQKIVEELVRVLSRRRKKAKVSALSRALPSVRANLPAAWRPGTSRSQA